MRPEEVMMKCELGAARLADSQTCLVPDIVWWLTAKQHKLPAPKCGCITKAPAPDCLAFLLHNDY
jgi:hypothetical protein